MGKIIKLKPLYIKKKEETQMSGTIMELIRESEGLNEEMTYKDFIAKKSAPTNSDIPIMDAMSIRQNFEKEQAGLK